jgi:hypothetical protein
VGDIVSIDRAREPRDEQAFRRQVMELVATIMQMPMGAQFVARALECQANIIRLITTEDEPAAISAIARVVLPDAEDDDDE